MMAGAMIYVITTHTQEPGKDQIGLFIDFSHWQLAYSMGILLSRLATRMTLAFLALVDTFPLIFDRENTEIPILTNTIIDFP